jgi:2,3-bisphosphoglycerate-independent phosphoglycerate mutase
LFFNFRADRVRQLTGVLAKRTQSTLPHPEGPDVELISMTKYDGDVELKIAFAAQTLDSILSQILSEQGKKFLKIAETEKYPHVTYFFNGGQETAYDGEIRVMIPSPKVATYDLQPEMSAPAVAAKCAEYIRKRELDVVILNFANPDMVGHTGVIPAAVKAIEAVDSGVGTVMSAVDDVGGRAIITADHGNAETMIEPETGEVHTAHTTNPVPLLYYDRTNSPRLRPGGILADIAPTMLQVMGLPIPTEMTGRSLLIRA